MSETKVLTEFYVCRDCGYKVNHYRKYCPLCRGDMQRVVTIKNVEVKPILDNIRLWRGLFKVKIVKRLGQKRCEVEALETYGTVQKGTRWILMVKV